MDAIECITGRMSIRKFKPDPVPKELIMEVLSVAARSPSYKNSQPWEVAVVSGRKKEELSSLLLSLFHRGEKPVPDLPEPTSWPESIARRIEEHRLKRAKALGRDLSDPAALQQMKIANYNFYGAPCAIFIFQDSSLSMWSIFDAGIFAYGIMLAARAKGLGTVPQAFLVDYAPHIKRFLGIPEDKRLVIGISIGYPDNEAMENSFRSERMALKEFVRWIE